MFAWADSPNKPIASAALNASSSKVYIKKSMRAKSSSAASTLIYTVYSIFSIAKS
jgi:hypothetical protein